MGRNKKKWKNGYRTEFYGIRDTHPLANSFVKKKSVKREIASERVQWML